MDLADHIEHLLCSRRAPDLPEEFVLPHYSAYSIANLAATVARILGVTVEGVAPPLPEHLWSEMTRDVTSVVLLILDAVGYRQLKHFLETQPSVFNDLISKGSFVPVSSVFPSTTVSALTSIWTGQPPLAHGLLGTKLLLPKQGVLANLLRMAPAMYTLGGRLDAWGWEPDDFISVPTLAQRLSSGGIRTVAHTRRSYISSALTRIFLRGMGELRGYVGLSDLWVNLRRTMTSRDRQQPHFIDVYWGGADKVGHVYGPEGEYAPAALRHLARSMEKEFLSDLPPEAREGTLLIVTADHGQIATPADQIVRLPDHPTLWDVLLLPPAGESRAAYLYVAPGERERVADYAKTRLSDRFALLDTERAVEAGLWGPPHHLTPASRARLGDLLLIARGGSRLTAKSEREDKGSLRGHHGGLTADEMLVPLLMVRMDDL
ncbi:MAG: alkaline phosphatase family protein [Anaerolineae bacterium]